MKKETTARKLLHQVQEDRSPELDEQLKQKRIDRIESMSLEYQLGFYVGEEIARNWLPTLAVDSIHSSKVISVTLEEHQKHLELQEKWYELVQDKSGHWKEWRDLQDHHKLLESKYLPKILKCYISPVNVKDEMEFKKGIAKAIYDSDLSHYDCSGSEDIEFSLDDNAYFTIVTLKRA
jgi:hypothetical protein